MRTLTEKTGIYIWQKLQLIHRNTFCNFVANSTRYIQFVCRSIFWGIVVVNLQPTIAANLLQKWPQSVVKHTVHIYMAAAVVVTKLNPVQSLAFKIFLKNVIHHAAVLLVSLLQIQFLAKVLANLQQLCLNDLENQTSLLQLSRYFAIGLTINLQISDDGSTVLCGKLEFLIFL